MSAKPSRAATAHGDHETLGGIVEFAFLVLVVRNLDVLEPLLVPVALDDISTPNAIPQREIGFMAGQKKPPGRVS